MHNTDLGKKGEQMAVEFLLKSGYRILERNWRKSKFEIDIIASFKSSLIFVEVKTRSSENHDFPETAVEYKKQRSMIAVAAAYCQEREWEGPIRFDIVSIVLLPNVKKLTHFRDAFFPVGSD